MGRFSASLKTKGDRTGLPATVVLENGRLSIEAGEASIGDWDLSEITLEQTPTGYRMAAEGEQLLLDMSEAEAFRVELSKRGKVKMSVPGKDTLLEQVDKGIAAAEKRWGALLPQWVFTRIMLAMVFGALILMFALPGLVSSFLVITGLLMVMFGAVVYTDQMLASKWLPGRMGPMHVLLFGVVVLMLGVLLGVLAR